MAPGETYHHTEKSLLLVVLVPIMALVPLIVGITYKAWLAVALGVTIPLLTALSFSSLTVSLDATHLRFQFGVGFIRRAYAFSEIRSARPVENPWYAGIGIHYVDGAWLYNVSMSGTVEIELDSGKRVRIGSDEAERLAGMINARLPTRAS